MRCLLILFALILLPVDVLAKEKADFIQGTFATEEGCKKLAAIEAGGPRTVETAPEVLTEDGFKGWEGACEFTRVFEHEPGRVWLGLMVCSEGAVVAPQSMVFIKGEGETIEVAGSDQDEPEVFQRCDEGKGKTKP